MNDKNNSLIGHMSALLTILIWGTTFISTKVLLKSFSPVEILFFRFVIGFVLLMVIYPMRLKTTVIKQEIWLAAAGFCGVTLYFLLENIALTYSSASNVGVIISIAPFLTAVIAHRFLDGEKLTARFFAGFFAAITGIFIISFNGSVALNLNPVGDILAVLAAAVWAVYSILTKKISKFGYNTIQTTRRIFLYGILFMIPATFVFEFKWGFERFLQPVNFINILFLGLGASALCFVTWNFAVKLLGATKTSVYLYLVPVITIVTSVLILDERVTPLMALGIMLTLAGLLLSENKIIFKREKKCG